MITGCIHENMTQNKTKYHIWQTQNITITFVILVLHIAAICILNTIMIYFNKQCCVLGLPAALKDTHQKFNIGASIKNKYINTPISRDKYLIKLRVFFNKIIDVCHLKADAAFNN